MEDMSDILTSLVQWVLKSCMEHSQQATSPSRSHRVQHHQYVCSVQTAGYKSIKVTQSAVPPVRMFRTDSRLQVHQGHTECSTTSTYVPYRQQATSPSRSHRVQHHQYVCSVQTAGYKSIKVTQSAAPPVRMFRTDSRLQVHQGHTECSTTSTYVPYRQQATSPSRSHRVQHHQYVCSVQTAGYKSIKVTQSAAPPVRMFRTDSRLQVHQGHTECSTTSTYVPYRQQATSPSRSHRVQHHQYVCSVQTAGYKSIKVTQSAAPPVRMFRTDSRLQVHQGHTECSTTSTYVPYRQQATSPSRSHRVQYHQYVCSVQTAGYITQCSLCT